MTQYIQDHLNDIILLCKLHQVSSIALFGSAANETMKEHSDIDLLVEFSEDLEVLEYADNYFALLEKLEALLGKSVDLVTIKSLTNPILMQEINRSKVALYAA
jgi:predicted nucleotidyltransferase